jgi:signal transduction histidine kinase
MVKEVDDWRIAHGHWSQPAEGQDVGDSIPYKLLKQRNKELEETVSDRTKEIEKQNIKLRNLNDTKTKLLSIIAHDLRSPFNAFMGLTEVMLLNFKEKLQNPDYFKLRLQQIHERAQHLYSVADNLLNWAWTQTDEISINWSTSKVDTIINEQVIALHDMAKGKDIAIALNIDSNSTVYTDPEILGIIIRNFVSNALKYSHRGGTININAIPNGRYTLLTIADRGVGMDQTKIQSVLTANNLDSLPGTEKEKGIGLGLQISLDLLNRIKSSYTIDSTPNVGTTISISIPTNPS